MTEHLANIRSLPIFPRLDEIADRLLSSPSRFLVLTAETAAGKSTAVPPSLLDRVPGKIVMLEPRRIATVAIANRISEILGDETGGTAGYRLHLESRVSARTRIEIITEAILTRMIQGDPALSGVSVVILDEFHERSVHADLALALLREVVSLREDLYVLVMSATINAARIASFLDAPALEVSGRRWPVEIRYSGDSPRRNESGPGGGIERRAARAVVEELAVPGGHLLVFLPGIAEIRRTAALLTGCGAEVLILHSSVPFEDQKRILADTGADGRRRVILSSSIAETSVTVPGVSVVVDSGLARVGRFDIPTGMNRLVTEPESEFSSIQRAGRAGRTGPGRCVRLWHEHEVRLTETPPEILRADILPLVLECALWGVRESDGLSWLDPPHAGAWQSARDLLAAMGALDRGGGITPEGRTMSALGVHPRIAAVALAGGIDLAVKYSQYADNPRDVQRFRADLERRLSRSGRGQLGRSAASGARALLAGFPDRIARHTADGVYQFPSGRLAALSREDRASTARYPLWIVAPEVDAGEREGRIYSREILPDEEAESWLAQHAEEAATTALFTRKDGTRGIRKTVSRMYGKLVLSDKTIEADSGEIGAAVCADIRRKGIESLPWSDAAVSFLGRARFRERQRGVNPSALDDASLLGSLEEWLLPFLGGSPEVSPPALLDALRYRCDVRAVDADVPDRIALPSGVSRPLVFEELTPGEGPVPVLEARIQDLFGCAETPRVLGSPVLLRLLSPARRPLQITRDLAGFWKNTWPEVIKEMKGRYPKHKWPENPLAPLPPRERKND